MGIDAQKINVLQGDWADKSYYKEVFPHLERAKIRTFNEQILPITRTYDNDYWWNLRSVHRIDIAVTDPRQWMFEDEVFDEYVNKICSVQFPIVCIFQSPLEEKPHQVDVQSFIGKLSARTIQLVSSIRKSHSGTVVLSPAIEVIDESLQKPYLDYFIEHRQYFDGYTVHCCNDFTEHTLAKLSSFLNQVMMVLPKKLWVTRWAVPTLDGQIINPHFIGGSGWAPYQSNAAELRLHRSFTLLDSIASMGSYWFYTGIGADLYSPRLKPSPKDFWRTNLSYQPQRYSYDWDYWHFLGMLTSDGQLKSRFLNSFVQFAHNSNA